MLEQERDYYDAHLPEWLQRMPGRFVLIKGAELMGTFDTLDDALAEGARRFGLQPYLIRRVEEQPPQVSIPALALGLLDASAQRPAPGPGSTA
jgi:hypothetical protein